MSELHKTSQVGVFVSAILARVSYLLWPVGTHWVGCQGFRWKSSYITFLVYLGTSWLQTIVWSILNHSLSDRETSMKHIHDRVPMLEKTPKGDQPQLMVLEGMSNRRVMCSHLPPRAFARHENVMSKRTKIVYGLRNPKDLLVSYYHHCRLVSHGTGAVKPFSDWNQTWTLKSPRQTPDSKVHGSNIGPIWGRQDPGGPHVGPMNLGIWELFWRPHVPLNDFSTLTVALFSH